MLTKFGPLKNIAPKRPILGCISTHWQVSREYISEQNMRLTVGKWCPHLFLHVSVGNCQSSPTLSRNYINFGPQTAKNSTCIRTHSLWILHSILCQCKVSRKL